MTGSGDLNLKIIQKTPPRAFQVGIDDSITINDCGTISLEADEIITFIDDSGTEYDVGRKEWGYYATPSINSRLKKQGIKTALVKNEKHHHFIMLVLECKIQEFLSYLKNEKQQIILWLDEID